MNDSKIMKFLLALCLVIAIHDCYSQHTVPPASPSGAALARNVNVPVNMYTGIPSIGVSLYNLSNPNGTSVPISLGYHAGGFKVQDVASPVGLGWNLQAGGMITRAVRGLPDDNNFFSGTSDYFDVSKGLKDGEHDIFYYLLPSGRSGKFVLDKDNSTIYTIPASDLVIEKVGTSLSSCSWRIRDEDGNLYVFGEGNEYRESTRLYSMDDDEEYSSNTTYVSSWMITRVTFPDQSRQVTFSYFDQYPSYSYENYSSVKQIRWENCSGASILDEETTKRNSKTEVYEPRYLKSISIGDAKVDFEWGIERLDLPNAKALSKINLIYDDNNKSSYSFTYSYFDAAKSAYNDTDSYEDVITCTPEVCYRLKLESINYESNSSTLEFRKFNYVEEELIGPNVNDRYDKNALPPRFSPNFDHWGFVSTRSFANWDGSRIPFLSLPHIGVVSNGRLRAPTSNSYLANMLTSIEFPHGRKQEFAFEQHYIDGEEIGGLRIASICNSSQGESQCTSYEYIEGAYFNEPVYHYSTYGDNGDIVFITDGVYPSDCRTFYTVINSESLTSLFDFNGTHVGYEKVKEILPNGSFNVYEYFGLNDHKDELPNIDYYKDATVLWLGITSKTTDFFDGSIGPPFPSTTSYAWKRGLPKSQSSFLAGDNPMTDQPISRIDNDYYFDNTIIKTINNRPSVNITQEPDFSGLTWTIWLDLWFQICGSCNAPDDEILVGDYDIVIAPIQPKTTIFTNTDENDNSSSMTTQVYYDVNKSYTFPTHSITTNQDGSLTKNEFRYAFDIVSSTVPTTTDPFVDAIYTLDGLNKIATPLQTITSYQPVDGTYKVVDGSIHIFRTDNRQTGPVYLDKVLGLSLADPSDRSSILDFQLEWSQGVPSGLQYDTDFEELVSYTYGSYRNIASRTNQSGITTSYGYGYSNTFLTSETTGSFTTNYDYDPLVGLIEMEDPNDRYTRYEYDPLNRLRLIRNNENNIIERYRYHYEGQDESLGGTIEISGITEIDEVITFENPLANSFYGKTQFIWDFGDGTVLETGEGVTTYTYTSAGEYTVTLTMINPEYEPVQISNSVTIPEIPSIEFTIAAYASRFCTDPDDVNPPFSTKTGDLGTVPGYYESSYFRITFIGTMCGEYTNATYQWQFREEGASSWTVLDTFTYSATNGFEDYTDLTGITDPYVNPSVIKNYEVQLVVTDDCSNQYTSNVVTFIVYGEDHCP